MQKAIVIGAGIAGIATSIRLARQGYEVKVYEANSYPGGKLTTLQHGDYRFDAGPSLFTLPKLVEDLFLLCGEKPKDHFTYQIKDSICNYFWNDGKTYQMPAGVDNIVDSLVDNFDADRTSVERYLNRSKLKYEKTAPVFIERSLHKISSFINKETIMAMASIPKLGINTSMHKINAKAFRNPKLVQIFDRFATYNGSSPYQTPGIMSMIPHLEMGIGTYFPNGGMVNITNSLVALAERHGVSFVYGTKVQRIIKANGAAIGVDVENEKVLADIVVSNMDVFSTYKHLLPEKDWPLKTLAQEQSSSALIFYWGISKSFPNLSLHNILFADDYKGEFEKIFKSKTIVEDPTIYINISSKANPSDAPRDSENWFVMINTPGNFGQDWDALIAEARRNIIIKINKILKVDIESLIVIEDVLDPRLIESRTQSHRGALYGTASNNKLSAFLRHANFNKKIKNLYFCGGSVHPGGGIPLCLQSAAIVSDLISRDRPLAK
ncbi:MAG: phytoene dehydrogenase [Saprospirales bacterium]|nr:phytoene dehydrogenase [Saprospirales bacterium]HAI56347.1 phytoene desaturase [Saprospirales bacterium]|tara:strand:+ start:149 stop:1630 length:1482 start_codon:yes stop_codon:yes gene_type:complete